MVPHTESASPSSDEGHSGEEGMSAAGTAATMNGSRTEHLAYGDSSAAMCIAYEWTVRSKAK